MVFIGNSETKEGFSASTVLFTLINRCKKKILEEDSMVLGILFGKVGCGKSVRAMQIGWAIDPTMTSANRICFNKDEFAETVINNRKCSIIGDEGISLFFSRSGMTKEGRLMAELMAQIRQRNLCVFICVPNLLSMDAMVLEMADFVAEVSEHSQVINNKKEQFKGNIAFFPELGKNSYKTRIIHYLKAKRGNPNAKIQRPFPYFTEKGSIIGETHRKPFYPVPEDQYRQKKEGILEKYRGKPELKVITQGIQKDERRNTLTLRANSIMAYRFKQNNPQLTQIECAKQFSVSQQTFSKWIAYAVLNVFQASPTLKEGEDCPETSAKPAESDQIIGKNEEKLPESEEKCENISTPDEKNKINGQEKYEKEKLGDEV